MKKFRLPIGMALIALLAAVPAHAKVVYNPDANTLWSENGQDVEVGEGSSADHWTGELGVESSPDGFVLNGTDPKKFSTARYLPADAAHPWLVWEIGEVRYQPEGYRGLTASLSNGNGKFDFSMNAVTTIPTGIYTFHVMSDLPDTPEIRWLRFDLYGGEVTFPVLKMVQRPENSLEVSSPSFATKKQLDKGDDVTFTVTLKEPAEDVSLTFYDSYTTPQLKINGESKLQLKPKDDTQKVWLATTKINSVEGDLVKPGQPFEANRMFIKATVLGGAVKVPIWTGNPYPFQIEPGAATK